MKFITTITDDGSEDIFVFPRHIHHDCMAEVLSAIRNQKYGNWERIFRVPVAAGFVDEAMQCHGHSETLNLSSRPEDTVLLGKQLKQIS